LPGLAPPLAIWPRLQKTSVLSKTPVNSEAPPPYQRMMSKRAHADIPQ
jgi:hypothetical protein